MTERRETSAREARAGIPAAACAPLRARLAGRPLAGAVVLGSGLGTLLEAWQPECTLAAEEIPGYPAATVPGHAGRVALVDWGGGAGLVFQGRVHFYEGRSRGEVTFAVRLAAALGARWILLTNAAGSLDPMLMPGSVLVVQDHVRLFLGARAARGAVPGPAHSGSPYAPARTEELFRTLSRAGLRTVRGVLVGGLGPSYETAAEVEMARRLGGSAACMSTVIEAEEARRCGLEVAAISLVTNLGTGLAGEPLDHAEVVAMAHRVGPPLARALDGLVRAWAAPGVPPAAS